MTQQIEEERGLVIRDDSDYSLSMVTTPTEQLQRIEELREFLKNYMVEGEDYGTIPGTPKPTLLKPGAEKLCDVYGLSREANVVHDMTVEDWDRPFFHYTVKATLRSMKTGLVVAEGLGSCNSHESKYRYRNAARKCPNCGAEAIIKGKAEFGGGWVCWAKKGGCNATFADGAPEIVDQDVGRVENLDVADQVNTILKMAKKRALVDAVLSATRSSGLLTQDIEDLQGNDREEYIESTVRPTPPKKASPARAPAPRKAAATGDDKDRSTLFALANEAWPGTDAHLQICRALGLPTSEEGALREHWLAHGGTYKNAAAYVAEVRRQQVKDGLTLDQAADRVGAYAKIAKPYE